MMLRNAEPDVEIAPPLRLVEEINHRVVNEYAEAIAYIRCDSAVGRSPLYYSVAHTLVSSIRSY